MSETTRDRLLHALESRFPLAPDPLEALARDLGRAPGELRRDLEALLRDGTVRRLGPVFDKKALGFRSTLVMGRVPDAEVEAAAAEARRRVEITHNYLRDHERNLWFTVIAPDEDRLEEVIAAMRAAAPRSLFTSLPAERVFKIDARFARPAGPAPRRPAGPVPLTSGERALARSLEQAFPVLAGRPFARAAEAAGCTEDEAVATVRSWLDRGVLRRFGAVLRHTSVGFACNGMCVFALRPGREAAAGEALAREPAVSHCYLRRRAQGWPYRLYAMAHGRSAGEIEAVLGRGRALPGVEQADVLYTTRELKKSAMRYFA